MVAIDEAKPQEQPPRRFEIKRVDQLLAKQPHGRRAQQDDALLVQPDDPLIGPKIEDLTQMVSFQ